MAEPFQERRRTPRVPVHQPQELRLGRRVRVRVIDISATGVLLWAEDALPIDSAGRLHTALAGVPFEAQAVIKRETPVANSSVRLLGASLTASPSHQRTLEGFLKRADEET